MIQAKAELQLALARAVAQLAPDHPLTPTFESPKQAAHGDLAVTVAMQLAKPLKANPRALAESLVVALKAQPEVLRWVESLEIAGPGFINLRLTHAAKQAVVREVRTAADQFGRQPANGAKLMVEGREVATLLNAIQIDQNTWEALASLPAEDDTLQTHSRLHTADGALVVRLPFEQA